MTDEWVIVCYPSRTIYASRGTRAEVEAVLEADRALAEKFGRPEVEHRVVQLEPRP